MRSRFARAALLRLKKSMAPANTASPMPFGLSEIGKPGPILAAPVKPRDQVRRDRR